MDKVAYIAAIVAFLVIAGILFRSATRRAVAPRGLAETVPPALRPGDTDDVLEGDRLQKVQMFGLVSTLVFAAFLAVYWLAEPGRMRGKEELFTDISVARGAAYFASGEANIEGSQITGLECSRCHGDDARGGTNEFIDPSTGQQRTVSVPELRGVFARYELPPAGYRDAEEFIRTTIERGRTDGILGVGVDMPTWSNKYGGPLTDQQIDDVLAYLRSIQEPVTAPVGVDGAALFGQFCSPCHGQGGTGGIGPAMVDGAEVRQFPTIDEHIAFVISGSQRGVPYGTSGRGTGAMPPRGGGSQLTDEQIRAIVEYERGL